MNTSFKPAKFLGWQNSWKETPPEIEESKKAGHQIERSGAEGAVTTVKCPEGGWYYKVDSSG